MEELQQALHFSVAETRVCIARMRATMRANVTCVEQSRAAIRESAEALYDDERRRRAARRTQTLA